ncbi:MAG: hypothetical protein IPJ19_20510 [Planctomycetes bacterium]|nr:hypothetical protein [Planctomycetota bacterium]
MRSALLVIALLTLFLVAALLLASIAVGWWLKRSKHASAVGSWIGLSLCGALSLASMMGAVLMTVSLSQRHSTQPGLVVIDALLYLFALLSACVAVFFAARFFWKLVQAPAAQPVRTTPAI